MEDDLLSTRNWGYYEASMKGNLGLQLMPSVVEHDTKSFLNVHDNPVVGATNGAFHPRDSAILGALDRMDYVRDRWINHKERFPHHFSGNPYSAVLAGLSASHPMQMLQQSDAIKDSQVNVEEPSVRKEAGLAKKRTANASPKPPKAKKSKKGPSVLKENGNSSVQRAKATKKSIDVTINGIDMDISGIPIPVCTCTGSPQQCYRWGFGGWQSACCTTSISIYPLPMSAKRRGARIAGRKMSQGAFRKVLEKLAAEGYNFVNPIDLKAHWAKHGTNKFVTIR